MKIQIWVGNFEWLHPICHLYHVKILIFRSSKDWWIIVDKCHGLFFTHCHFQRLTDYNHKKSNRLKFLSIKVLPGSPLYMLPSAVYTSAVDKLSLYASTTFCATSITEVFTYSYDIDIWQVTNTMKYDSKYDSKRKNLGLEFTDFH